jgi:hypothetical protein
MKSTVRGRLRQDDDAAVLDRGVLAGGANASVFAVVLEASRQVIIGEEHMQQTGLPMPSGALTPRVTRWRPKFRNYRDGLDQVIRTWGN